MDASKEHPFILHDGTPAASLVELLHAVEEAPEEIFLYHVTSERNDFENWITACLHEPELAQKISGQPKRKKFLRILKKAVKRQEKDLKKRIPEAGSSSPENREPERDNHLKQTNVPKETEEPSFFSAPVPEEMPTLQELEETLSPDDNEDNNTKSQKRPNQPIAREEILRTEFQDDESAGAEDAEEEVARITIGVPGFDGLVGKGVPKGSAILLTGGPGTGKTTFGLQALRYGIEQGENCLYLTFEESEKNLIRHLKDFGWDPRQAIAERRLIIKKVNPMHLSRSVEALLARASGELLIDIDEVEGIIPSGFQPDRVILDSLSAVAAAFAGTKEGYRIYVEQIFNLFERRGTTSFLISEREQTTDKYARAGIEEFLADAVFIFYNIRRENERVSALEILKIRGTPFHKKIVPFKITEGKGIVVYPQEAVF
ncbi:MAG: AAA family ATPase [DPANN group archaeon]|nr:AAA family ATPase [DPANN group archaeon]